MPSAQSPKSVGAPSKVEVTADSPLPRGSHRSYDGNILAGLTCQAWFVTRTLLLAVAMTIGLAVSCGSSSSGASSKEGTLAGVLELGSTVPGGSPEGVEGTITLGKSGGHILTTPARSDGKFSLKVPAGSYTVTGHSPKFVVENGDSTCYGPTTPVQVNAGQTSSVVVSCPTK